MISVMEECQIINDEVISEVGESRELQDAMLAKKEKFRVEIRATKNNSLLRMKR